MDKAGREVYSELVCEMNESYTDVLELWEQMDRMTNVEYELPPKLKALDFMRTWRSTWPADAVTAGAISLSSLDPRLRLVPWLSGEQGRRMANDYEKIIKWQMYLAGMRHANYRADICNSSLRYGMIVGQCIHLPTQKRALKASGSKALRQRAIDIQGDWMLSLKNPKNVRTSWSEYGLERVAYINVMSAQQIVDFWGKKAGWLDRAIETGSYKGQDVSKDSDWVLVDVTDYERRLVWAYPGDDTFQVVPGREIVEHEYGEDHPYMDWLASYSGSDLEQTLDKKVNPLLITLAKSENWLTDNLLRSMAASEVISEFAQPKTKKMGPNPKVIKGKYGTPGGSWEVPSLHDIQPMPRNQLDPGTQNLIDRFGAELEMTTISRVLMNAEALAGETYSGFNMRVQTALGKIMPHKLAAETFEARWGKTMLYQAAYGGFPIKGWIKKGTRKDEGHWDEIDPKKVLEMGPENIYLSVKLRADVPTDRQQQVNTALMMAKGLPVGMVQILEELGYDDPEGVMDDFEKDRIREAIQQARVQRLMAENSGAMEQEIQARVQEIVQQMMKQGAAPSAGGGFQPPEGGGVEGLMPEGRMPAGGDGTSPPGVEGSEIASENGSPAQGGAPVAQMNPGGATKGSQRALMGAAEGM